MAKQSTKQGDERLENVESALGKTELFIEENQKLLWTILAVVVAIVLIIFCVKKFYMDPRAEKASSEIFKAEQLFEKEQYETALNGDGNNLGFLDVIDKYGHTKSGKLACYYAGISYMKLEKYDEAIDYLSKFNSKDQILSSMALGAIGDCYMQLDKVKDAVSYYGKAAKHNDNGFTSPMFMLKEGMTYEIMGENAKALDIYKTLKEKYPLSNEAMDIDKNISYLEEKIK